MINKLLLLSMIFILPGCAKKQLEYDMLIATDHQLHEEIEVLEQDKNIIKQKKEIINESSAPIIYKPGFVARVNPVARLQSSTVATDPKTSGN